MVMVVMVMMMMMMWHRSSGRRSRRSDDGVRVRVTEVMQVVTGSTFYCGNVTRISSKVEVHIISYSHSHLLCSL